MILRTIGGRSILGAIGLLLAIMFSPSEAAAVECSDTLGVAIFHAAWATPRYDHCEWSVSSSGGGEYRVSIKSVGESRINHGDLWVTASVVIQEKRIVGLEWSDWNAKVRPGTYTHLIGKVLHDLVLN